MASILYSLWSEFSVLIGGFHFIVFNLHLFFFFFFFLLCVSQFLKNAGQLFKLTFTITLVYL